MTTFRRMGSHRVSVRPDDQIARPRRRHPVVRLLCRLALPLLLLAALGLFLVVGGRDLATIEALADHRRDLAGLVAERMLLASAAFVLVYAASTAASLPLGALLTVAGGLLFGPLLGTLLSAAGATAGAMLIFLAARRLLGDRFRDRIADRLRRMDAGFRGNAFNYLLAIRLIPVVPFWLVNIAAAFAEVSPRTFAGATAIGILPATFVYALVGHGLGAVVAAGEEPGLRIILRPEVLAPMIGLAVLAVAPVFYRKYRRRRDR